MHGGELIDKYFSKHPDKKFNDEFRSGAVFFCGLQNSIYKYEKLSTNSIKVLFENKFESRCQPIIINGEEVGHVQHFKPYTILLCKGAFICKDATIVKENKPIIKWRPKGVKIRKSFIPWSKKLIVIINNDKLNFVIKCASIHPDYYFSESIKCN